VVVVGGVIVATSQYPDIRDYPVPPEADDVLEYVVRHHGNPPPGYVGGAEWKNRDQQLPRGRYREYDIDKKRPKKSRTARRIVADLGRKVAYYTRDHYATFTRMRWP
jgi:ribonuclease T1